MDGPLLKKWQIDAIQLLVDSGRAELSHFLVQKGKSQTKSHSLSYGFRYLERKIRNKGPLEVVDIQEKFKNTSQLSIQVSEKRHSTYVVEEGLKTVEDLQLDFALRFGFGILRGAILNTPKYGIWSFHHGDPKQYRGGPFGFWEIMQRNPVNGAILQRLTDTLDGGIVLKEGHFKTILHNYKDHVYRLLEETKSWPLAVIKNLQLNPASFVSKVPIKTKAKIYKVPSSLEVLVFLAKELINRFNFHYRSLFRAEKWNIGIVDQSLESIVESELKEPQWLKEAPTNQYWADPFQHPGSPSTILCESFDYSKQRGDIQSISENGDAQTLLELATHLSYPFTFTDKGKHYVLPENFESAQLSLYEIEDQIIKKKRKLLDGSWIDPSLCYADGRWWLFCTEKESPNEKLFLFFANTLEDDFTAHPLNPILTDIQSARPAGKIFQIDKNWYRPAQNCSATYGGSIRLKKIERLTITDYQESFVKEIFPSEDHPYSKGLHTLSPYGNQLLIDGKRFYFNFHAFKAQLLHKLKRLIKS